MKGAGAGWRLGHGSGEQRACGFGCVVFIVFGSRADARNGPSVTEEEVVVEVWWRSGARGIEHVVHVSSLNVTNTLLVPALLLRDLLGR